MPKKPKLIAIVGPTSSGKSELAIRLAKKFNGEIISADSRQVYRGLNIGTGKVLGEWRTSRQARRIINTVRTKSRTYIYKSIPHHCIDFVDPKKQFSAEEFKNCAQKAIKEIVARGKIPVIAGGTGFWIDSVVYDTQFPNVPPNAELRKKLAKKSAAELLKILQKLDQNRAKTIEQKNPRRLIRAIEIAQALGKVPAIKRGRPYDPLWIGISPPAKILKSKIKKRLEERMGHGMIPEARRLRRTLPWKRFYELGLEYRFLADFVRKRLTRAEMQTELAHAIEDYARRQMVWFKRNHEIKWIKNKKEAAKLTALFIKR